MAHPTSHITVVVANIKIKCDIIHIRISTFFFLFVFLRFKNEAEEENDEKSLLAVFFINALMSDNRTVTILEKKKKVYMCVNVSLFSL